MIAAARREVLPDIRWAIAAAWLLAIGAELTGRGRLLHHDVLIQGGLPRPVALGLFLLAWQAMTASMMLPSSLPMIRLFDQAAARQPHARWARAAFVLSYAVVWTLFGAAAFMFDIGVHTAVSHSVWLFTHPYFIGGSTLVLAGAFQFSPVKEACLRKCRNPGAFILRYYQRGVGRAFTTGFHHGAFCLGCCWALMLVAFAAGLANLVWMAGLTLLMTLEKRSKLGPQIAMASGFGLILAGIYILVRPLLPVA